jgi:hypothetical protein
MLSPKIVSSYLFWKKKSYEDFCNGPDSLHHLGACDRYHNGKHELSVQLGLLFDLGRSGNGRVYGL